MSSDLYVKHAVGKVEKELGEVHQQLRLPSKVSRLENVLPLNQRANFCAHNYDH